jgi:2-polyprenyl-3-methyl-5-hydroxy-6-metoxy-1,4-benzoquinol methylase
MDREQTDHSHPEASAAHFDAIARDYDAWKKKNWYYYRRLTRLVRRHVPEQKRVLEIGTATGEILAHTRPATGIGIDTSARMIAVAREKFAQQPQLRFYAGRLEDLPIEEPIDHLVMVDVVEHVEDMPAMVRAIRARCSPGTEVFVSMANPHWEPLLLLLEKLKLKMPEGDHYRLPARDLVQLFLTEGFTLKEHGYDTMLPFFIPVLSEVLNNISARIPGIKASGLIEYFIFS